MNWMDAQLDKRSRDVEAISQAHIDAGDYGASWIKVDHMGNLTRVDPKKIIVTFKPDPEND